MTISVRTGGAFREADPFVKTGGLWKAVQNGYVRVAGVWREFYTALSISLPNLSVFRVDGLSPASLMVSNNGNIYAGASGPLTDRGPWINNPALVGDFQVRVTSSLGSPTTGSVGVWESCASPRSWTVSSPPGGYQFFNFTMEIRRASDGVIMASRTGTIQCDRT